MWLALILIFHTSSTEIPIPIMENSSGYKCIMEIISRFIETNTLIIPMNKELGYESLFSIEEKKYLLGNLTTLTYQMDDTMNQKLKQLVRYNQMHFVEFSTMNGLKSSLSVSINGQVWKSKVKFVIFSNTYYRNISGILTEIVQFLSEIKIFTFLILLPTYEYNSSDFSIFSWNPFRDGTCNNQFDNWYALGSCKSITIHFENDLFGNSLPEKFPECAVNVQPMIIPPFVVNSSSGALTGFEIYLLNLVADILDVRLHFFKESTSESWGRVYENGTCTGILDSLYKEATDIAIGAHSGNKNELRFLDVSIPYYQESIAWCASRIEEPSDWELFFLLLEAEIILLIVVLFASITGIIWAGNMLTLYKKQVTSRYFRNIGDIIWSLYAITLGEPVPKLPLDNFLRTLLLIWMIFSMYVGMFFQTSLTSIMTRQHPVDQFNSIAELVKNNYRLMIYEGYDHFFSDILDSENESEISERYVRCYNLDECLQQVAHTKRNAVTVQRGYFGYTRSKYHGLKSEKLLHCLKENIATFPIHMVMRKKYYLRDRIDEAISHVTSFGFSVLWRREMKFKEELDNPVLLGEEKTISIRHLLGIFIVLILGYICSIVVFITELKWHLNTKKSTVR